MDLNTSFPNARIIHRKSNIKKKKQTIKGSQICDPCEMETPGILKLHKQSSLWRGKHSFEFDMNYNPYRTQSLFSRQIHQYSHTWMDPTLNKWDTTKTWWLCCFFPHNIELHLSCLHFSSQMSPIQVSPCQTHRSIALLMCDGQCLPWPW